MLQRDITKEEVIEVIEKGEIIEEYAEDNPFPSCLMFRMVNHKPLHVVVANNSNALQ